MRAQDIGHHRMESRCRSYQHIWRVYRTLPKLLAKLLRKTTPWIEDDSGQLVEYNAHCKWLSSLHPWYLSEQDILPGWDLSQQNMHAGRQLANSMKIARRKEAVHIWRGPRGVVSQLVDLKNLIWLVFGRFAIQSVEMVGILSGVSPMPGGESSAFGTLLWLVENGSFCIIKQSRAISTSLLL